ncbi:MAG: hypothetical protein ACAH88_09070 [Roseimicrobium sp.]
MSLSSRYTVIAIAFGLLAFQSPAAEPKPPVTEKEGAETKASVTTLPFDRTTVVRVEAIRFKLPIETLKSGEKVIAEFSFLSGRKVDLTRLEELAVKKVELTPTQIDTLIQALYGKNKKMSPAACYEPHHLFLFYDVSGGLINTVELCFSCTSVSAFPGIPEKQWYRHDFRKLAKLCEECGIGLELKSAEEYSQILDAREGK